MKAVVLDGYTLNPGDLSWSDLEKIVDLTVYDRTEPKDVLARISDSEIVITNKTLITKEIIDKAPNIKYIGILSTGINVVDLESAKIKNIPVTNVPAYSTNSVAQLVFAFILEICHHVGHHSNEVKLGRWTRSKDFCFWDYPLIELDNKTMGIIGFGSIGKKVALIAQSFGMRVLVYNRSIKREYENDNLKFVSLEELYNTSDIISLHVPLDENTKGLINRDSISLMKDGVIIINTARGGLIIEADLVAGLKSRKIYYAGLDVVSEEPMKQNSPLLEPQNILITPHIGWAPYEARMRLVNIAVNNVKGFLNNNLQNVVNGVNL